MQVGFYYYGFVGACRAVFEVLPLMAMVKLRKKLALPYLAVINAVLMALTGFLMGSVIETLSALLAVRCVTGIANGLFIDSVSYMNEIAPKELKAMAASILVIAACLAGLIGNLTADSLMELLGARRFYTILGVWLVAAICVYLIGARICGVRFERSK